jgi:hypothetical protein
MHPEIVAINIGLSFNDDLGKTDLAQRLSKARQLLRDYANAMPANWPSY